MDTTHASTEAVRRGRRLLRYADGDYLPNVDVLEFDAPDFDRGHRGQRRRRRGPARVQ